jgi:thioredoxin reductase (NADPH)
VRLQDTKTGAQRTMDIDGVFIFIGFNPDNQLVPAGVRMNAEGFVITNDQCATSIPGIYAIGDLREKFARQIVLSAADGCMAALSAAHYVETRKAQSGADSCALPDNLS